ncbi:MAG TPA: 2,3-bisphosphoglycerate-independent phosphoglycerate mutase [Planctomycetota bacterium]|nr:2,3-bisphosphoglycerate-independent phosphoglycerate mutase [Planctomycetota bacterium]
MTKRRVALVVLDGWGINPKKDANPIELGRTPHWHRLLSRYPATALDASGESVGLRSGLMGNSEVGHMNMAAGRVIWQEITRIDKAIDDGTFRRKECFRDLPGTVHLMGLVSDGGVHSDEKHYLELVDMFRGRHVFHAFLDGRDTPNNAGAGYVKRLVEKGANIKTICGRYWAMDRDKRWDRVEKAWRALVLGEAEAKAEDPVKAVEQAYAAGETDEFVKPRIVGAPAPIKDGDSVVFFNFRADRARELTSALVQDTFDGFKRPSFPKVKFVSMTQYHEDWKHLCCAFPPQALDRLYGEIVADRKLKQLRIAETEKYAHVTFFFNGGTDTALPGEERILVQSPKVATYDLQPEMSAPELTDKVVAAMQSDAFDTMVLNYANADMVGHTGILPAAVKAVEALDGCLERLTQTAAKKGWTVLITADHGNVEQMVDYETGQPHTYHTTNPVPFLLVDEAFVGQTLRSGDGFKAIAPTLLDLLGIQKPESMEGKSLLKS